MGARGTSDEVTGTRAGCFRDTGGVSVEALLSQPKRWPCSPTSPSPVREAPIGGDSLLPLFWPDADQAHARGALRKAIHIIRRLVGEGAILVRGDEELAVNPEQLSCDVLDFDAAVAAERWGDAWGCTGLPMEGFCAATAPRLRIGLIGNELGCGARRNASRARWPSKAAEGNASGAVNAARQALELGLEDERPVRPSSSSCSAGWETAPPSML